MFLLFQGRKKKLYCFAFQDDVEQAQSIYSQIINTDSRLCQNLRVSMFECVVCEEQERLKQIVLMMIINLFVFYRYFCWPWQGQ